MVEDITTNVPLIAGHYWWCFLLVTAVIIAHALDAANDTTIPSGKNQSACSIKASTIPVKTGVFFIFICPLKHLKYLHLATIFLR